MQQQAAGNGQVGSLHPSSSEILFLLIARVMKRDYSEDSHLYGRGTKVLWLRTLLTEICAPQRAEEIYCDNQDEIAKAVGLPGERFLGKGEWSVELNSASD